MGQEDLRRQPAHRLGGCWVLDGAGGLAATAARDPPVLLARALRCERWRQPPSPLHARHASWRPVVRSARQCGTTTLCAKQSGCGGCSRLSRRPRQDLSLGGDMTSSFWDVGQYKTVGLGRAGGWGGRWGGRCGAGGIAPTPTLIVDSALPRPPQVLKRINTGAKLCDELVKLFHERWVWWGVGGVRRWCRAALCQRDHLLFVEQGGH